MTPAEQEERMDSRRELNRERFKEWWSRINNAGMIQDDVYVGWCGAIRLLEDGGPEVHKLADLLDDAKETIRTLTAENARLRAQVSTIAALQARVAACERDAARYRWLTDDNNPDAWDHNGKDRWVIYGPEMDNRSLDAAIDAALNASPTREGK